MPWRDLPSLQGKVAVITGGNSGIGFQTGRALAAKGARVVLAVRDLERGKAAIDRIRAGLPAADVEAAELDLADMASVRAFGEHWSGRADILVNNAAVMAPPRRATTRDGFELQFGTNHLGHFVLTGLLLPALSEAPAARVATVSSILHFQGGADVLDANDGGPYNPTRCYANSKLANLLFAMELQRRASAARLPVTSTAAHPGASATGLFTDPEGMGASRVQRTVGSVFARALTQSAAAGARSVIVAATVAEPGSYTGPQRFAQTRGRIGSAPMSPLARDEKLARRLWQISEDLTGFRYLWP